MATSTRDIFAVLGNFESRKSMLKRHSDHLENLLDKLAYGSIVKLSKDELRHIYAAERLGKNTYRDLFDRLPDQVSPDDLLILQEDDDLYIIKRHKLEPAVDQI